MWCDSFWVTPESVETRESQRTARRRLDPVRARVRDLIAEQGRPKPENVQAVPGPMTIREYRMVKREGDQARLRLASPSRCI